MCATGNTNDYTCGKINAVELELLLRLEEEGEAEFKEPHWGQSLQ